MESTHETDMGIISKKQQLSVDLLQSQLDQFILTIFEAMRSNPTVVNVKVVSTSIIQQYNEALFTIDNLVGIKYSKEEQEAIIFKISDEYEVTKCRVLELEKALISLNENIDKKLLKVK